MINIQRNSQKLKQNLPRSKEEKDKEKAANAALIEEYGFCTMDGHKEKIGNFRYLPPLKIMFKAPHPLLLSELSLPRCSEVEASTQSKV